LLGRKADKRKAPVEKRLAASESKLKELIGAKKQGRMHLGMSIERE
jgi:hypothetical protein